MGPTWGPSGSCRPQMGPMLAPWTLPSGILIISADAQFMSVDIRWSADQVWATTNNREVLIFKYFHCCVFFTEWKTTFNSATKTLRYTSSLVSVYSNGKRKLPSHRKRDNIAWLCLGNVVIITTTSELIARFLKYLPDYEYETSPIYPLTTAVLVCSIARSVWVTINTW